MTSGPLQALPTTERRRLQVRGLVQGVGFRPYVYRCAQQRGISGFVQNGPDGVVIEAEGIDLDGFVSTLQQQLPPLARIDQLQETALPVLDSEGFAIRETAAGKLASAAIPPDTGLCADCLAELFDSDNRRHLHPFIACTNCGPRYTMTRRLPYDRAATSMADFTLCSGCEADYNDPASRRFHAEPTCCHDCGPRLSLPLEEAAAVIKAGGIVAIKGIGGFHLACDARNPAAITRLRLNKRRDGKPFAVMVLNADSAAQYARLSEVERDCLQRPERPVVVLEGRGALPDELSPGLDSLGLFLPYTAIHYLLFHALLNKPTGSEWLTQTQNTALVMTSANLSGDPLLTDNREARDQLAEVADLVIDHDRDISARADDSVLRVIDGEPRLIRRARGYVPVAIPLANTGPAVLGVGAHLKNSVTLLRDRQAWLSPHIGDLDTPATVRFQQESVEQLMALLETRPELIACDWHRDYASTRLAEQLACEYQVPLVRVQHHHAHLAAVLAVCGHEGPALGIALDGHGLGADGEAWGGELMQLDGAGFQRLGHLTPLPIAGGDRAAREPWRLAAGVLHQLGRGEEIETRFANEPLAPALHCLLATGDVPVTSAAGRLFDAAAGLLGVNTHAAYEGEAPMQLEALVQEPLVLNGGYSLEEGRIDFSALLAALADCDDPVTGASLFHGTLIEALSRWAIHAADTTGIETVALAGGCFLNRHLATHVPERLRRAGLTPLLPSSVPPNDGSISLGQAWVARRQLLENALFEEVN
ncbi:MAG: carbamoyltransferase HypF [Halieaceae bacterium]|jgi:hydrogenase maturation protein HypF|nr:carbamoyltransferase HypF [Halieaceae bacterium]